MKRWLESNRGKERNKSSVEKEVNNIIHKDFKSVFGNTVGEIPKSKKSPGLDMDQGSGGRATIHRFWKDYCLH